MADIDTLLSKLARVRKTGPDRWIASSPTRDDKHPSLSIRLMNDGRILLHDFGGSSVEEVLDAMGLDWGVLFPPNPDCQTRPGRQPLPAADILRCVAFEALVVLCAAKTAHNGTPLNQIDMDRLSVAVARLQAAVDTGGLRNA
jgi:hypothetical protein